MAINVLIEKIKKTNNPSVFGLDPNLSFIPKFILEKNYKEYGENLLGASKAILEFNKGLIDALCKLMPAVKPQSAYYEMFGAEGVLALSETISYAKQKGLYVILDVKRNDIGTTAEAYANAYIGKTKLSENNFVSSFYADSVTLNGYLGIDGIKPFINCCNEFNKSIFVLVKTSNPSSGDLQDKKIGNETVFENMAKLVDDWGKLSLTNSNYSNVGAVVGATYPNEAVILRQIMKNTYFLVPGYGAQGGKASDVANCFNNDGLGAIVNSSRGIMCAYKNGYDEKDFEKAAYDEAIRMRDEIVSFIK